MMKLYLVRETDWMWLIWRQAACCCYWCKCLLLDSISVYWHWQITQVCLSFLLLYRFFSVLLFYGPNFQADYRSCQILERCLRDNFWRQVDWYLFTASMIILCHTNHWKHSESLSVFCMTSDRFWHPHLQQASATSQAELAQSPLSNSVWWLHLLQHPLCGHYRGW